MSTRRKDPYLWVTWITGLLSGENHCEWQAWLKAHYKDLELRPKEVDLTVWKAQHGQLVTRRAAELRAQGSTVYLEDQNKFNMQGRTATVGGVPDIVSIFGDRALVSDAKTGKPRDKDVMQVLMYMLILPYTHPAVKGLDLDGEVVYLDRILPVPAAKLTGSVRKLIQDVIQRVAADAEAVAVPSQAECRFCDITAANCSKRVEAELQTTKTSDLF